MERRAHPRKLFKNPPLLCFETEGNRHVASLVNVSLGGCFLNTTAQVEEGKTIFFTLRSCPKRGLVEFRGRVLHGEHPKLSGIGIKLEGLSAEAESCLRTLAGEND